MDGPEVPPYFICPISLDIMRDPVTVSTGVSYDRDSIDCWLSTYNRDVCPVTKQPLADRNLTPNSTLLRLIHSWAASTSNSSDEASSVACKPRFDVSEVLRELSEPAFQLMSLKKVRTLIQDDAKHRDCMEKAGVTSLVASIISRPESHEISQLGGSAEVIDEAASVLHLLSPTPEILKDLSERRNGEHISSLCAILQRGAYRARNHAALLLGTIFKVVDDRYKNLKSTDLFDGVVEILKDQNSSRATTITVLSVLMEVIPHGSNLAKAVEAGAMSVLVELLAEEREERRLCEAMLCVLELLCRRADGRSALLSHPAGLAAVAGKILTVSHFATERAVKVLLFLCRYCGGCGVVEEMMEVGAVAKLCMVVQVEGNRKTREKAKEIMGLHLKAWNQFPCFPLKCLP